MKNLTIIITLIVICLTFANPVHALHSTVLLPQSTQTATKTSTKIKTSTPTKTLTKNITKTQTAILTKTATKVITVTKTQTPTQTNTLVQIITVTATKTSIPTFTPKDIYYNATWNECLTITENLHTEWESLDQINYCKQQLKLALDNNFFENNTSDMFQPVPKDVYVYSNGANINP